MYDINYQPIGTKLAILMTKVRDCHRALRQCIADEAVMNF